MHKQTHRCTLIQTQGLGVPNNKPNRRILIGLGKRPLLPGRAGLVQSAALWRACGETRCERRDVAAAASPPRAAARPLADAAFPPWISSQPGRSSQLSTLLIWRSAQPGPGLPRVPALCGFAGIRIPRDVGAKAFSRRGLFP